MHDRGASSSARRTAGASTVRDPMKEGTTCQPAWSRKSKKKNRPSRGDGWPDQARMLSIAR
jgi:hypothetical protein